MSSFQQTNVQRNVLFGAGHHYGALIGFDVTDPLAFRSWLKTELDSGRIGAERATESETVPDASITIALSHASLAALGVNGYRWNARFCPDRYAEGMKATAGLLGDVADSAPTNWDEVWQGGPPHVVLWLTAPTSDIRKHHCDQLRGKLTPVETGWFCEELNNFHNEAGQVIEHFGYVDGISQPRISGVHRARSMEQGGGRWTENGPEQVALGEFLLGRTDDGNDVFPVPSPDWMFRDGTFMVLRKLEQRVLAFRSLGSKELGQKLVGRDQDGTPLAKPDPRLTSEGQAPLNAFSYGDDPEGFDCPLAAHVRRSNPRVGLGFGGRRSYRHRLIRRGMTYGDVLPKDAETDEGGRGIMFRAFNARIHDQFEFIQTHWLNDGAAFNLGNSPDLIAGSWEGSRQVVVHDREGSPTVVDSEPLVVTKGGGYYLVPAMAALRRLAETPPNGLAADHIIASAAVAPT